MSFWSHTHTYTKSGDSNTCENSDVHAALPSMPICTSALLHVFLVTHIPIQSQVIAIHVRIAMLILLCQACPFAHLLSFMSFWSHTHTYTKSGDSNTCGNRDVHAALPSMPICTSALRHVFLVTHTHTYTKSGDSNTCENSYAHAALLSMPFCTSTLLHVFLVTHTYLYKVR